MKTLRKWKIHRSKLRVATTFTSKHVFNKLKIPLTNKKANHFNSVMLPKRLPNRIKYVCKYGSWNINSLKQNWNKKKSWNCCLNEIHNIKLIPTAKIFRLLVVLESKTIKFSYCMLKSESTHISLNNQPFRHRLWTKIINIIN